MSLQQSLDKYFKTRSKMNNLEEKKKTPVKGVRKQRPKSNLSLIKPVTPKKEHIKENVIDLCSDDEEFQIAATSKSNVTPINSSQSSVELGDSSTDSSQRTVIYALTPKSPTTPRTPGAVTSSNSKSPRSTGKYFSPTKKRSVIKRTPVKRKLDQDFSREQPTVENETYIKACEGLDDKTVFLLSIINKYLNCASLKHLLLVETIELLKKCLHVIKPGMRLVCRLYWRKEGWYNVTQLKTIASEKKHMDDPTFHTMLQCLVASGLITPNQDRDKTNMTFEDLADILKVEDVKQICKFLKLNCLSKQGGIDALRDYSRRRSSIINFFTGSSKSNDGRVFKLMSDKAGPCYKLSDLARSTLYRLYILMYLGMNYNIIREKKLELTIIYDKAKRETYPVDKNMQLDDASVVFENKDQFDRYVEAVVIYEDFIEKTNLNEKRDIVVKVYNMYKGICEQEMFHYMALPSWLRRFTPPNLYVKVLEAGVMELKKFKTAPNYDLARDILTTLIAQVAFRHHKQAEWYSEKAHILYLNDHYDEAAEVLLQAFKSNLSEEAKDGLRPRVRKIANQASNHFREQLLQYADKESILEKNINGLHIHKQPMEFPQDHEGAFMILAKPGERKNVKLGYPGGHWEGRIVTTIFFLLFWDIIYKKPRGAVGIFLSYYQMYPLDMFCESFYTNRKALIEERLAYIEARTTDQMLDIMKEQWDSRPECEMSGITRSIEWDSVCWVSRCLGPRAAAALCRRLALHYRYACSGFPDLTLWNVHNQKIKFVEVKTDTDKPSMKQIQWMHYLKQSGIDSEFCYVGANTTRTRSRPS